ncbi:MAG: THUMP domain-containing protein [Planctomycetia bacterium]|nr:THUMP domain-containing protein [Planctomycetia bacterium]
MTRYFATCARGLEPVLGNELTALGASSIEPGRGGVTFAGDSALLYRACLWLRSAVRVLRPIHEFDVNSTDELYDTLRAINWTDYLTVDHTLAVDCNVRDSAITHSQYAAHRVKDAICDQFRERTGRRPSVDTEQPMIGLNLHISKNHAILSLDSSWDSLHKRGYRPIQTRAPLNEALAAGLLLRTGWNGRTPLVDPLCGSGTFCIEGVWIALNRAPGLTRKWFAFQGWLDFDRPLWNAIRDDARRSVKKELPAPIVGSDVRQDAIEFAEGNARAAGVGHLLKFTKLDVKDARPPGDTPGTIICNPPYGERIGEEEELIRLYRRIGDSVSAHWPGWRLFVFTSNDMLAKKVGLKVLQRVPFFNGSLQCHLWEYQV